MRSASKPWMLALALAGCGGLGGNAEEVRTPVTVEPTRFLQTLGAESTSVLRAPEASIEELEAARREARGDERRERLRDCVAAYMHAWIASTDRRERRRLRRRADRLADAGMRGSRDPSFDAQMDFAKLWMNFVNGERSTPRRAERFTRRYAQTGGALVGLAWMIRGEAALAGEDYDEALESFRFAFGQVGTPLYAYALYRTAVTHRVRGDDAGADQAMIEAASMGCDQEVPRMVLQVANAAASSMGAGLRRDPDGQVRPATCAPHEEMEREDEESEGWRPAE